MFHPEKHSARPDDAKRSVLGQLMPFNECRFDDCIAYLSAKHNRPLNTYEMMKLHVMIDVYHAIARGKPVIGGALWPFANGPVARSSKSRVAQWRKKYEERGEMPDGFILQDEGDELRAKPIRVPETDDFSPAELEAMERAWKDVIGTLERGGFRASQDFFHCDSFIGRAWAKAYHRGTFLDWNEIIDEYDAANQADHSRIKVLLHY